MIKSRFKVKELVLCSMFSVLIAIGAFIKIPIGLLPVTFQVFFAVMAGLLLGPKLGAVSVYLYVIIGLTGVPVFTQGGGIMYVFQPSFGYMLGFGVGAFVTGFISERFKKKSFFTYLIAALAFTVPTYLIGLPYLYIIVNFHLGSNVSVDTVLVSYFLSFLPNDILSYILASFITARLKPVLIKMM